MKRPNTQTRYQLFVGCLLRILAAGIGGYLLSIACGVLLSLLLPVDRGSAVLTALLLSFAIHCGAIMYAFHATTVRQAWCHLLVPSLCCALLSATMIAGGVSLNTISSNRLHEAQDSE